MDVKPDSPASDCASPDVAGGGSKVLHFSLPKPAVSIPLKRRVEAPELSPAKPEEESAPHSPVAKAAEAASRPVAKPGEAASLVKAGDAASPVAKAGEAASPPATKADASPVTKAAEAASPPVKLPDSVGVPASDHRPLIEYLFKVLPLTEPVTAGDFQKFCLHSPETNALRWYALSSDTSDSYMTEIMAKDLDLPMMPHEKLLIMPRAADLFVRWCQDQSTGWIPLFTSGGFFWAANYDPFEPLPAIMPTALIQKILVTANAYDGLIESWRSVLIDCKKPAPLGPFPEKEEEQRAWFSKLGISDAEAVQALALLKVGRVPLPLKELCLRLQTMEMDFLFLEQNSIFPYHKFQGNAFVAAPMNLTQKEVQRLRSQLEYKLSLTVILVAADLKEIKSELKIFQSLHGTQRRIEAPGTEPQEFLNGALEFALANRVSDIHLEPLVSASRFRVRMRQDGSLVAYGAISNEFAQQVLNRIKILAHIDISEKKQPRDGSFTYSSNGHDFDLRVSIIPQFDEGERVVLRILDSRRVPGSLEELGFATSDIYLINKALGYEHGLFMVSGPTGSGKTTTLYSAVKSLPLDSLSLQTVEDPVEFKLDGCGQYQATRDCPGETLLRHILRADPDFIMIGEIRDPETAKVAGVAANTGHMVLTTLHANDAVSSIFRLHDFGVPFTLLVDVLRLIISQRLLRRICKKCRYQKAMTAVERTAFLQNGYPIACLDAPLYASRGCHACNNSGFQGRFAVVESLFFSSALTEAILGGASREVVAKLLVDHNFRSMYKAGLAYVLRGDTPFSELSSLVVR